MSVVFHKLERSEDPVLHLGTIGQGRERNHC